MRIHKEFIGGNIKVVSINDDTVTLENELRDTTTHWFYQAFCVEELPENDIAFTLETAYFGTSENKFSQEKRVALGRCFAEAIREYLLREKEGSIYDK